MYTPRHPIDTTNNFDLIRLFAALTVFVAHITEHKLVLNATAASFAFDFYKFFPGVPTFFIISGFLISNSWLNRKTTLGYVQNRALRIYPALFASTVITTILLYALGFAQGVSNSVMVKWFINQLTLVNVTSAKGTLGDFAHGMVNGSLWTLPVEISFYIICPIILALSYTFFRHNFKALVYAFMALSTMLYLFNNFGVKTSAPDLRHLAFYHFWWFGLGIIFCLEFTGLKKYVAGKFAYYLAAHVAWSIVVFQLDTSDLVKGILQSLTLAPLIFAAAYTLPNLARKLVHKRDYSYGIYLFHRPYIHTLSHLGITGLLGAICVTVITVATAIASWHLLEKPFLNFKKHNAQEVKTVSGWDETR